MGTCTATNQDGSSCSNDAMDGSDYCHVHQKSSGTPPALQSKDEHGFWPMLGSALAVILAVHFLLQFVLAL
ncbi:hypothetical protein [Salinibacter altiplanensis]|uniref:hypothetical protein n=1 Tax=Salinibacter altiplanensis TaxID=1803181 RepID=UPI000C9EE079|nr:hypothetical protein [Salinibacter altiplanensis]